MRLLLLLPAMSVAAAFVSREERGEKSSPSTASVRPMQKSAFGIVIVFIPILPSCVRDSAYVRLSPLPMSAEEWVQFEAGRNANLARKAGRQADDRRVGVGRENHA